MAIYVKIAFIFLLFLAFKHDFIIYINFNRIPASNTASDEVTNRANIEYLIHIYYILVLSLQSKLTKNLSLIVIFDII